eukprot:TRINITY_DN5811_c0_g1_i2.p1 TRINITY_DN5811_c0_g1~~TRINITY_DN5811_c0_g1_i2.p1  ORF type:complete len:386 (-),score=80.38 TRINITY_DN5811_c0_g1_i2:53-1210(-)
MNSWITALQGMIPEENGHTPASHTQPVVLTDDSEEDSPTPVRLNGSTNKGSNLTRVSEKDFEPLNVVGRGSFGKVLQVRKKDTGKIYAMKVLNKATIIERNEMDHTKAEQSILTKLDHPFLVHLYYSFQTVHKLYFVMDYINGGELFFHLQIEKKFTPERVRFYCAEIVLGLEYLHQKGVVYRDLKPENILLNHEGHICMTDFGISKEGLHCKTDRTDTFCGTPEYLAPEVLENMEYGKEVDWWSFGTLMFEMLTGLPPFYSEDVQLMYAKILNATLIIPKSISPDARSLLSGLLERDPRKRLSDISKIKAHPYFESINWDNLYNKKIPPPFIPPVKDDKDTSQIDPSFTEEDATGVSVPDSQLTITDSNWQGFTYVGDSNMSQK